MRSFRKGAGILLVGSSEDSQGITEIDAKKTSKGF